MKSDGRGRSSGCPEHMRQSASYPDRLGEAIVSAWQLKPREIINLRNPGCGCDGQLESKGKESKASLVSECPEEPSDGSESERPCVSECPMESSGNSDGSQLESKESKAFPASLVSECPEESSDDNQHPRSPPRKASRLDDGHDSPGSQPECPECPSEVSSDDKSNGSEQVHRQPSQVKCQDFSCQS